MDGKVCFNKSRLDTAPLSNSWIMLQQEEPLTRWHFRMIDAFSYCGIRSPILNIGLVGGGGTCFSQYFRSHFWDIYGVHVEGSAKPFFVEISRIHVEGVGKWLGRRGEVRQAILSLQGTAALLLGFLRPRLVWCK